MPKGAALGSVSPSFPAFSLWFCVGLWQLQAVVGWTTKLSMCFGSVQTSVCTPTFMLLCLNAHVCSPLCVPGHTQQHFLQQRSCREQKCRYLKQLGVDIQAEPVELRRSVCVLCVSVCSPWSTEEWKALASAHFRLLSFLFRPHWRKD